jgi:hypothetical protein
MIAVYVSPGWRNPAPIRRFLAGQDREHVILCTHPSVAAYAAELGFNFEVAPSDKGMPARRPSKIVAFWDGEPAFPERCAYPDTCLEGDPRTHQDSGIDPARDVLDRAFRYDLNIEVVYPVRL